VGEGAIGAIGRNGEGAKGERALRIPHSIFDLSFAICHLSFVMAPRRGVWARGRNGEGAKGHLWGNDLVIQGKWSTDTYSLNVMKSIKHFRDLDVYQGAMALVMRVFELTKDFPSEERYALTDQLRRSSRSVCANLAEA
jgi:hypothetical protein